MNELSFTDNEVIRLRDMMRERDRSDSFGGGFIMGLLVALAVIGLAIGVSIGITVLAHQ